MIRDNGYQTEEHTVKTTDGYFLTLYRIPHEKNSPCLNEYTISPECKKPVVFVQHGLISSAADYLIAGRERGLAFILADAGFDVWLGNFRGNTYSRRHESRSPNDKEFWKFSWHELGTIDLPEMIDYVLQETRKDKLHYIGHSQGTTTFLVMTSTRKGYNDKIKSAHLMAPIAFMSNMRSPVIQVASRYSSEIETLGTMFGHGEFSPSGDLMNRAGQAMCRNKNLAKGVCSNAFFLLAGFDSEELDANLIPEILKRYPAGSSVRQIAHYGQEVMSGKFRQYDHGMLQNVGKYGTRTPPEYELSNVSAPVSLYYGNNDWLAAVEDVEKLRSKLPNVRDYYRVQKPKWNHIDFLWARDAKNTVYDRIVENMKNNY